MNLREAAYSHHASTDLQISVSLRLDRIAGELAFSSYNSEVAGGDLQAPGSDQSAPDETSDFEDRGEERAGNHTTELSGGPRHGA